VCDGVERHTSDLYTKELSDVTRINVGIHPKELPDKLLLAEHREIKRIPNVIKSGRYSLAGIPAKFTLGKGHVKFLYNKLRFLHNRYVSLHTECIARSFNVQDYSSAWSGVPEDLYLDYETTEEDRSLIVERILSKGFTLQ
jgi:deoxyribonuclease (pyrimidine dimer)